jgi:hypothetical protein
MTVEEAAFATQQPVGIVEQYVRLIEELDLDTQQVYARSDAQLSMCADRGQLRYLASAGLRCRGVPALEAARRLTPAVRGLK